MNALRFTALLVSLSLVLAACAPAAPAPTATPVPANTTAPEATSTTAPEPTEAPQTIVDIAAADERFSTLVTAVQAAGLVETLQSEGPFTVFAPTNDAFAQLPEGALDELLANPAQLEQVLLYHVVPGKVMASDVVSLTSAETAPGIPVSITVDGDVVTVGGAQVTITDIEASNGVIHVIDSVILPPGDIVATAVDAGSFTTLAAALEAAGLVEALQAEGPFTVFAPTDEAFANLPEGTLESLLADPEQLQQILLYHVAEGRLTAEDVTGMESIQTLQGKSINVQADMGSVMLNEANVAAADVIASNGIIHVIDTVLIPPMDMVETAQADGRFTTLLAAAEAAGLVETLKGEGPFTLFAPTDDAFARLPAGTIEALLEDPDQLSAILLYHVVSGKVMAADVVELESAETVQGQPVSIRIEGDQVFINDAQVIITDIETSNGVIHVIDSVLLPPQA
jgi:transforming growth factor-beta-induced protein